MKLPVDRQDFRALREDGMAYVDKTPQIIRMCEAGKFFFLSRPRRFGKSIMVSTLAELYSGDRELFRGLHAYDNWDFARKKCPVIWIDFSSASLSYGDLRGRLSYIVERAASQLGYVLPEELPPSEQLDRLILLAAKDSPTGRVVVLIDEYDKAIVRNLNEPEVAVAVRDELRDFYGVLKGLDRQLELVFLTGVSAFGKVSLFSALNNLRNLTLDPLGYDLVGITQAELEATFGERLERWSNSREEIRAQYNGYCWGPPGSPKVYNSFSVIRYLDNGLLRNHWANSGSPKWLADVLAERGLYDIDGTSASGPQLLSFPLEHLSTTAVLFQTGYLTVVDYEPGPERYTLAIPNREVRMTFEEVLLEAYSGPASEEVTTKVHELRRAIVGDDLASAIEILNEALEAIPHQLYAGHGERFYHALIFLLFRQVGIAIEAEVSSHRGRADAILKTDTHVYIFEFKLDASAAAALAQIGERGYAAPFRGDGREVVCVGVNIDSGERRVTDWGEERLPTGAVA